MWGFVRIGHQDSVTSIGACRCLMGNVLVKLFKFKCGVRCSHKFTRQDVCNQVAHDMA